MFHPYYTPMFLERAVDLDLYSDVYRGRVLVAD